MIVVDCSLVMAGILNDEESDSADRILSDLAMGVAEATVPAHFYLECNSVLITALRRNRLTPVQFQDYQETLQALPLLVDHACIEAGTIGEITDISREHELSVYDAAYLEIAVRKQATLATLDKRLNNAASNAGVKTA